MTGKGRGPYIRRVMAGEYKPSRYGGRRHRRRSPNSPGSASPPRRVWTQNEWNNELARREEVRVANNWIRAEHAASELMRKARLEKERLENKERRIAAAIKKQKQRNNRLAAAAAVNVNNAKNLNKVFKNSKTLLGRLRAHLRR